MATILVIENDSAYRDFVVNLLTGIGHRMLETLDGAEALMIARAQHPELIITDILMPGMDGFEFIRQLRCDSALALTRIVFNTGHFCEREAAILAQACGVSKVLAKPSDSQAILQTVTGALQRTETCLDPSSESPGASLYESLKLLFRKLSLKVEELEHEVGRRKQAEETLEIAGSQLQALFDHARDAILFTDDEGRFVDVNPAACGLFGFSRDELLRMNVSQVMQPREFATTQETGLGCGEARNARDESTVLRKAGETRAVEFQKVAQVTPALHLSLLRDVTEWKVAETALRGSERRLRHLSQELMKVQEDERRRIARELHDEIGGALTATKLNLQSLLRLVQDSAPAELAEDSMVTLEKILRQVRDLSLDLRPSMLDDLGLAAALRWCLDRQAQGAGFVASFDAWGCAEELPPEIKIASFRVAQEALTNVVRHAGAGHVRIELRQSPDELQLLVRDDGNGFDVQAAQRRAMQGASLGLLSMQERVSLLGGRMEIEAVPRQGTVVRAFFPISTVPS